MLLPTQELTPQPSTAPTKQHCGSIKYNKALRKRYVMQSALSTLTADGQLWYIAAKHALDTAHINHIGQANLAEIIRF